MPRYPAIARIVMLGGLLAWVVAACGPGHQGASASPPAMSTEASEWCGSPDNRTAVAFEMDLLRIAEPAPGWLDSRIRAAGYRPLGSGGTSWAVAVVASPGILDEFRQIDQAAFAAACEDAFLRAHPASSSG